MFQIVQLAYHMQNLIVILPCSKPCPLILQPDILPYNKLTSYLTILQTLSTHLDSQRPSVDQLGHDVLRLKQLVARSRPPPPHAPQAPPHTTHPDVQRVDAATDAIASRWETLTITVSER